MNPSPRRLLGGVFAAGLAMMALLVVAVMAMAVGQHRSQAGGLIHGDANCSQEVNAADALADLVVASGANSPAACVQTLGDVDCNQAINVQDVSELLRYSAVGERVAHGGDCPLIGDPERPDIQGPCAGPGGGPSLPSGTMGTPESGAYQAADFLPVSYLGEAAEKGTEMALIPGRPNEAVIAGLDGYVRRVALDQSFPPQQWGDFHNLVESSLEQGFLSLAFSPNYENDCRIYVYFTPGSPAPSVLARFHASPTEGVDMSSEEVLLTVEQPDIQHNGGHIVFGLDGYLYLGFGDGGYHGDPEDRAQDMTTLLGKMVRIDVSGPGGYTIPPDNPFIDGPGNNRDEIYALGFRNPWRYIADPVTGDMWIGDVGQDAWEEVDKLEEGGNYGWDCYEGTVQYDFTPQKCQGKTFIPPRTTYQHVDGNQAVTGGMIYRGAAMPELYGWFVYGDYASGRIWALNPNDSSAPIELTQAPILITSFTLGLDGEIYIVSYSDGIFKLAHN